MERRYFVCEQAGCRWENEVLNAHGPEASWRYCLSCGKPVKPVTQEEVDLIEFREGLREATERLSMFRGRLT